MYSDERRRSDRRAFDAEVGIRRHRSPRMMAGLHNMSRLGCQLDLPERVALDEQVWVAIPGLAPLAARVSWLEGWKAGLLFDQPMHPAVFDHVAARLA